MRQYCVLQCHLKEHEINPFNARKMNMVSVFNSHLLENKIGGNLINNILDNNLDLILFVYVLQNTYCMIISYLCRLLASH